MTLPIASATTSARQCDGCRAEIPAAVLVCLLCGRLVHAERLNQLAALATAAEGKGDKTAALAAWRGALELLPAAAVQHQRVVEKIQALGPGVAAAIPAAAAPDAAASSARGSRGKWLGGLGALGALLLKFKWALLFLLGKGKLLLIGLTQAKTFLSMAIAMGVYASLYGWRFGLGLIVSLYVHEMGHVAALRRYGIAATAPMFIPGFGAFVRLKQNPATAAEDARVGLAGPLWGTVAAVVCLVAGKAVGWPILVVIAHAGAWLNLFNLLPVWQLDGARGFSALSRRQRMQVAAVLWLLALLGGDGVLFLLAIAATARAFGQGAPEQGDGRVQAGFLALAIGLTILIAHAPAGLPGH